MLSGVATWTDQRLWHAGMSANWPDVMVHSDLRYVKAMYDAGTIPFLHMMFKPSTSAPHSIISAIDAGEYDTEIDAWLLEVVRLTDRGVKMVVVPYPEMNGTWTSYGPDPNNFRPDAAAQVFRSVVIRGRELGLDRTKVLWCWAPNDVGWGPLEPYYPGDDVVDIVGGSCYNWGGFGYDWATWRTPAQVIDPYVTEVRKFTQKPIVITQVGSGEGDSRTPGWLDQLVAYAKTGKIDGFIWFSISEFTYQPGVTDFNRRVASLDADRPDHWFSPTPPSTIISGSAAIITYDRDQADWGSLKIYPDGTLSPFNPDKAVIHWGGYTNPGSGEANEAAVLRAIQKDHRSKEPHPWFDIAYGVAVGNTGLVYRLRGLNRQAATLGDVDEDGIPANHEAWAFLWIGGSGYVPSPAALASMGRIIRECQAAIPNFTVEPHSNFKATECPGDLWRQWIAERGWETETIGDYQMRTLEYGEGTLAKPSPAVAAAQAGMIKLGSHDKNTRDTKCGTDGVFRFGTRDQATRIQRAYGLPVTGKVDRPVWELINRS